MITEILEMTFAEKLKEVRLREGLTEAKLSKESGIPLATLHSYSVRTKRSKRLPSAAALLAICEAMGVDPREFAGCEDLKIAPGPDEPPPPKRPRGRPRKGTDD